jgi:hypothetical protein
VGINKTILRKVNILETLTNEKGQRTNDSFQLLAFFAPTYLLSINDVASRPDLYSITTHNQEMLLSNLKQITELERVSKMMKQFNLIHASQINSMNNAIGRQHTKKDELIN